MKRQITSVARGFTLLELLVAITVLAVVSMIAWRGLDSLVLTRERLEPEGDEVRSLLTTFGQMERDLTHVPNPAFLGLATSPLNIRIVDGEQVIELARIAGTSLDRATEVQTVFYRIVDGTLVRQATPALPAFQRADVENFETARLLNHVRSMNVRVWQVPAGWVSPFASEAGTLPQTPAVPGTPGSPGTPGATPPIAAAPTAAPGIEVTLMRTDGRSFRRVFLVGA